MTKDDRLQRISDRIWEFETSYDPELAFLGNVAMDKLVPRDETHIHARASIARSLLMELDSFEPQDCVTADWAFIESLKHRMSVLIEAPSHYWLDFEFTPYKVSFNLSPIAEYISATEVETSADFDRYAVYASNLIEVLNAMVDKTAIQSNKNIRMHCSQARTFNGRMTSLRMQLASNFEVPIRRMKDRKLASRASSQKVVDSFVNSLDRCFERLLSIVDDTYWAGTAGLPGLAAYEGGGEYYEYLIRAYSTSEETADRIHDYGVSRVELISENLAREYDKLDVSDACSFKALIDETQRMQIRDPMELHEYYLSLLKPIEDSLDDYFLEIPESPYDVLRLEPADESGMTYGYYQMPSPADAFGYYRYNAANLVSKNVLHAAPLIFHELIPGHHFQLAYQLEQSGWHPLRKFQFLSGYIEGWAEYAADLAEDMGGYRDVFDRIGRMQMQLLFACRLVVDTAIAVKGWSIEQAAEFLHRNLSLSREEIDSEVVRYATDVPGQCLSHGLGHKEFVEARNRAERTKGSEFSVKEFHKLVLGSGAISLTAFGSYVDQSLAHSAISAVAGNSTIAN